MAACYICEAWIIPIADVADKSVIIHSSFKFRHLHKSTLFYEPRIFTDYIMLFYNTLLVLI
jgi:hypothetical protein